MSPPPSLCVLRVYREWIVIWLIVVEVVVGLFELLGWVVPWPSAHTTHVHAHTHTHTHTRTYTQHTHMRTYEHGVL